MVFWSCPSQVKSGDHLASSLLAAGIPTGPAPVMKQLKLSILSSFTVSRNQMYYKLRQVVFLIGARTQRKYRRRTPLGKMIWCSLFIHPQNTTLESLYLEGMTEYSTFVHCSNSHVDFLWKHLSWKSRTFWLNVLQKLWIVLSGSSLTRIPVPQLSRVKTLFISGEFTSWPL